MKLSLVVPCYNEEGNVELFYQEVNKFLKDKILSLLMMEAKIIRLKSYYLYIINILMIQK